jgi:hypothetical protein
MLTYKPGSDLPFFDNKEGRRKRVEKWMCMESVTCYNGNFLRVVYMYNTTVYSDYSSHENKESQIIYIKKKISFS